MDVYVTGCDEEQSSHMKNQLGKYLSLAANLTRGDEHTLLDVFPIGGRVQVTNYSPWRGLRGTILTIHMIAYPDDEPFCYYLVTVDGAHVKEPIWFEYSEVELITPPHVDTLFVGIERLEGGDQKGST